MGLRGLRCNPFPGGCWHGSAVDGNSSCGCGLRTLTKYIRGRVSYLEKISMIDGLSVNKGTYPAGCTRCSGSNPREREVAVALIKSSETVAFSLTKASRRL